MWQITQSELEAMVDTWNSEVAENESDRMTAEEMLGYLDDPVVINDGEIERRMENDAERNA